ncbi:aminopeptidase N [Saccharospirillum mangrovi]|uniref:aminopeptidase N n=1 Tax=Saccharospirillum mangrovi TaxID=2161747 RepID=UPI000D396D73|nr:aminopeptidase N [Saccharospirillum mangrovi]
MRTQDPKTIHLKDYRQPDFWVKHTDLTVRIFDDYTEVSSQLALNKNANTPGRELVLNGVDQEIIELSLNGKTLSPSDYRLDGENLILNCADDEAVFAARTRIYPQNNTSLEGLYQSGSMFCTQCEAEGFRKITFYPDRPDVMATFTTRIEADKKRFPVLLANGNPIEDGDLDGGRHFATWNDPHPKPSYLFAMVAGQLARQDDTFTTASGREVSLRIFVEPQNAHKVDFALASLKKSMRWDEERFGREYDLDLFMIVASDFFNMGAMENKGLNIFNSAAVLATPDTSKDMSFERIEAIIAHEYFHNWSGNRVTCRDWFQLSLKEGFTVFRDSEFTADMHDRAVKRIEDVIELRARQFPEDNGPMAHPVRPSSYIEINNFYTSTVYEKGAEVVRMIQTLIGQEAFRKGSDLYFERFDGQAVTTDDFVACMSEVSGRDLTQFKRWYSQAGTPRLAVSEQFDANSREYRLMFRQSCPPTPGQDEKSPFVIPVKLGLLGADGQDLPINTDADYNANTQVLTLTEAETTVVFTGVNQKPVPSLLRDFSAPVRLSFDYADDQLAFLARNDANGFNRWDALQQLYLRSILRLAEDHRAGRDLSVPSVLLDTVSQVAGDAELSHAIRARMLSLPGYAILKDAVDEIHIDALIAARRKVVERIASGNRDLWRSLTESLASTAPYEFNAAEAGRRDLQGVALWYWLKAGDQAAFDFAADLYRQASNQTDRSNALRAVLAGDDQALQDDMLSSFYERWKSDNQMVEQWLSLQASAPGVTAADIDALMQHEAFDVKNPNKVRSVIGGFANNVECFHDADGNGYQLVANMIAKLNALNPQIAARLVTLFSDWKRFEPQRRGLMQAALKHILSTPDLSRDVFEMAERALKG